MPKQQQGARRTGPALEAMYGFLTWAANGFGVHDTLGNVYEWTEDCWHDSYSDAPSDGSAWTSDGDCSRIVVRGGSWGVEPRLVRSANRNWFTTDYRNFYVGFRVARTLAD